MELLRMLAALALMGGVQACAAPTRAPAAASITSADAAPSMRLAKAPPGFVAFCERSPDQCRPTTDSAQPLRLDAEVWQTLQDVNTGTNLAIAPQADSLHYGVEEYWAIPTDGYGDCDDYVLTKRSALIARGLPESALSIAIVFTQRFVRHTVLIVATDKGNYVLDNLRPEIVPWNKADYGWIKHQDRASITGWAYF